MNEPAFQRLERERNTRVAIKVLKKLRTATTEETFEAAVRALEGVDEIMFPGTGRLIDRLIGIEWNIEQDQTDNSLTAAKRESYRVQLIELLEKLVAKLPDPGASEEQNLASVLETEKEFLAEKKVPWNAANTIGSFLSGKEGSLGAQMSQLRRKEGKSGVPSQGGRKTRRRRTRRV